MILNSADVVLVASCHISATSLQCTRHTFYPLGKVSGLIYVIILSDQVVIMDKV